MRKGQESSVRIEKMVRLIENAGKMKLVLKMSNRANRP